MNLPLSDIHDQLRRAQFSNEIWAKLLDIRTIQYTREEVDKLHALCKEKQSQRDGLKATSILDLWKFDLRDV